MIQNLVNGDEVFYKVKKIKGIDITTKNLETFLYMPNLRFIDVSDIIILKILEFIKEYKFLPMDGIHAAIGFIADAETIISQDMDFDNIKGLKRKWMIKMIKSV